MLVYFRAHELDAPAHLAPIMVQTSFFSTSSADAWLSVRTRHDIRSRQDSHTILIEEDVRVVEWKREEWLRRRQKAAITDDLTCSGRCTLHDGSKLVILSLRVDLLGLRFLFRAGEKVANVL